MVNQSRRILGGVASARSSDSQSQGPVAMQVQNLEKKRCQCHTHVDVVTKNCYKVIPALRAMWKWRGYLAGKKRQSRRNSGGEVCELQSWFGKTRLTQKKESGSFSGGREPVQLMAIASWQ